MEVEHSLLADHAFGTVFPHMSSSASFVLGHLSPKTENVFNCLRRHQHLVTVALSRCVGLYVSLLACLFTAVLRVVRWVHGGYAHLIPVCTHCRHYHGNVFSVNIICISLIDRRIATTFCNYVNFWGRPFVKRFALCYRCVVCLSVVCDVCVLWPNSWMDQDETWHGVGLGPGHNVLDGEWPSSPSPKGHSPPTQFSARVCCGQTVAHLSYCWALVTF